VNKKEKILIVDDDPILQESLVSILEGEGYYIDTARTGAEAEAKVRKEFFHIALLDVRLPDTTGTDLLAKINKTAPRMKKLVMTGYPDASSAIQAVNQRADAYLTKPFEPEELIKLITENIEVQRDELKYSQGKVLEYIQNRVKELDSSKERVLRIGENDSNRTGRSEREPKQQ
jgi:DNA-binding NtrC family response regulator